MTMLSFSSPLIRVHQDWLIKNNKLHEAIRFDYDELSFGNPILVHNASKADQTHEILDLSPTQSNSQSP